MCAYRNPNIQLRDPVCARLSAFQCSTETAQMLLHEINLESPSFVLAIFPSRRMNV